MGSEGLNKPFIQSEDVFAQEKQVVRDNSVEIALGPIDSGKLTFTWAEFGLMHFEKTMTVREQMNDCIDLPPVKRMGYTDRKSGKQFDMLDLKETDGVLLARDWTALRKMPVLLKRISLLVKELFQLIDAQKELEDLLRYEAKPREQGEGEKFSWALTKVKLVLGAGYANSLRIDPDMEEDIDLLINARLFDDNFWEPCRGILHETILRVEVTKQNLREYQAVLAQRRIIHEKVLGQETGARDQIEIIPVTSHEGLLQAGKQVLPNIPTPLQRLQRAPMVAERTARKQLRELCKVGAVLLERGLETGELAPVKFVIYPKDNDGRLLL